MTTGLDLQTLLNSLDRVFFTLTLDGVLHGGDSPLALKLFGKSMDGRRFDEIVIMDDHASKAFYELMVLVEQGLFDFRDLGPLLPQIYENPEGRKIGFQYQPFCETEGGAVSLIICTASDKTDEMEQAKVAAREAAQTRMVLSALSQRQAFQNVVSDAIQSLGRMQSVLITEGLSREGGLVWYRNLIHTLKGNLGSFGVEKPASMLHDLEDQIADGVLKYDMTTISSLIEFAIFEVDVELRKFITEFGPLVGISEDGVKDTSRWVPQKDLAALHSDLVGTLGPANPIARAFYDRWMLDDAQALFGHFERVVTEVAHRRGKEARCVILPSKTRVVGRRYRGVIGALVHVFRNSVAHGIEEPSERSLRGKPREGTVTVRMTEPAEKPGRLRILVTDDGGGIAVDQLKKAAIEAGLITEARAKAMTEAEAQDLVFGAGVSTARGVTDVAGRGVGLSALREEVEAMGGKVSVASVERKGTAFELELPLYRD